MKRLNLGPGPHYQKGWINVEVEQTRGIFEADVYLEDSMVLPFEDESVDQIYCGHILEHIEWEKVPVYLAELKRVLKPGGVLLIVGPDVFKAIELYKRGQMVLDGPSMADGGGSTKVWETMEWEDLPGWDAPRHYWNCSAGRLLKVLAGDWEAREIPITSDELNSWPVVTRIGWQCAVSATKVV